MYERKLINYLPHILRDVREYKAILNDGEEAEIVSLWTSLDDALKDQFIQDATEYGIKRWERLLGIVPKATSTLDERRFSVLTKVNEQLPFTITSLKEQLKALCGDDNYSVELDSGKYTLKVEIALEVESKYKDVEVLLKRIVPANMIIDLSLKYNKHNLVAALTHTALSNLTHYDVRNTSELFTEA